MNEMGDIAAEIHYDALLAELDKEELEIYEVGLIGDGLDGAFNQIRELHVTKYKEEINGYDDEL